MMKRSVLSFLLCACAALAQTPAKIDFRRDVQPIFQANCIGCHGASLQMNGFRLDRRRDAMKGGTIPVIGPSNADGSRMYQKLIGSQYGPQMPPTGPLKPEQIAIIKAWIDQGAIWPDEVASEASLPAPDPRATRLMDALRNGDTAAFRKSLAADPGAAKLKGFGGSTPLMYATLYSDAASVGLLLEKGADPNVRNNGGATALMWAVDDVEKVRLLIDKGADARVRSDDQRTALLIASGQRGAAPVVKLLLDHGANLQDKGPTLGGQTSPLVEAAFSGDEAMIRLLLEHGADPKTAGPAPLAFAMHAECTGCFDLLLRTSGAAFVSPAMFIVTPPRGDASGIKTLLDHGADAKIKDELGSTMLIRAAASDALPTESMKALIAAGVDVNAPGPSGKTALDLAKQRGRTPVVDLLLQAGAREGGAAALPASFEAAPAPDARAAVERSLPLVQRNDATFLQKSGCVSCHNDILTGMAVASARQRGLAVDEAEARQQLKTIGTYLESWRDRMLQGIGIPGDSDTMSYILLGLAASHYTPDAATDAMARLILRQQSPDGRWIIFAHRPPIESSDVEVTAVSMRALHLYAPKPQRAQYQKAVALAAAWLRNAPLACTEDRVFQLLGLAWAGASREEIQKAARGLAAAQRPDGGWSQISSLTSDAYATGEALFALHESGALPASDEVYRRGVGFLLSTQLADGSWYVKSRALPIQPYFESGFPHGHDQFISAAGTNWAILALLPAVGETAAKAAP
jgi:ankyrin repeat protein